ncbi:MAG: hypothetical protein ACI9N0_000431 [Ilumatobacter sp.]|jgi:hypothetical protein
MTMKSKSMRKKSVAILAGLAVAGAVGASAASLNGLNSDNLGADTGIVASCDITGINVDYTTAFDATVGDYFVDGISLSDVSPDCADQTYDFTAIDGSGVEIFNNSDTLTLSGTAADTLADTNDGNTASISVPAGDEFLAESVEGIALSISGT